MTTNTAAPMHLSRIASIVMMAMLPHAPVSAEVYKCVAAGGHITYQQTPCAGGQRGTTVELEESVALPPSGDDTLWSAAARDKRVIVGMPKPFVIAALGRPGEIRGTARAPGT